MTAVGFDPQTPPTEAEQAWHGRGVACGILHDPSMLCIGTIFGFFRVNVGNAIWHMAKIGKGLAGWLFF